MRVKHVDTLWKKAPRDVDSVQCMVRVGQSARLYWMLIGVAHRTVLTSSLRAVNHALATVRRVQFDEDQLKPPAERQWLHHEIDAEGMEPFFVLANRAMLQNAVSRGNKEPISRSKTAFHLRHRLL